MANGVTHAVAGGLSGFAVALCDGADNAEVTHDPILAAGVGTFCGKLPDILEPAFKNPHHRQFFHSFAILIAAGYGIKKAYEWQPENNLDAFIRGIVLFAGAGYVSHLLLDAATSRSLPLLGKI